MTPSHEEALRALRIADRDIMQCRGAIHCALTHNVRIVGRDKSRPYTTSAEVEKMVDAMRRWAGEVVGNQS